MKSRRLSLCLGILLWYTGQADSQVLTADDFPHSDPILETSHPRFASGPESPQFAAAFPRAFDAGQFPGSTGLAGYLRSTFTGSYVPITGFAGPSGDDNASNASLPFTFFYDGYFYTEVRICTNGWIELGSPGRPLSLTSSLSNENLFTPGEPNKTLAAWWDDLSTGTGSIQYATLGSAPNRIFVVEWKDVSSFFTGIAKTINFQIRLYETSNLIEFWYGSASGTASTSESASFGIEDHIGGTGHFIDGPSGSTSAGTTNLNTTSGWPAFFYRFSAQPLTLLRPNGGERFFTGTTDTIRWYATGVTNVKLEYSNDAGDSWSIITASTAAGTGTYAWSVPGVPTDLAKIRVTDVDRDTVNDISDTVFTVSYPPSIRVSPDSISFVLDEGDSAAFILTIANDGQGDLNFQIQPAFGAPPSSASGGHVVLPQESMEAWRSVAVRTVPDQSSAKGSPQNAAATVSTNAAAPLLPLIVSDLIGDASFVDIKEVRGHATGSIVSLQLVFQTSLVPSDFGGFIGLDIDQDSVTGVPMPFRLPAQNVGCEYIISMFNLDSGIVDVQNSAGSVIASVTATIESDRFTFSVPFSLLSNDDGLLNLAAVVGDNFGPRDWIPDVGHGTLMASWLSTDLDGSTVPPGDSTHVTVRIRTDYLDGGDFLGYIAISNDDPQRRNVNVPVRLSVLSAPHLLVTDSVAFPTTYIGYPDTVDLILSNNGSEDLVVISMAVDNSEFSVLGPTVFAILSNTSRVVGMRFDPSSPGAVSSTLSIVSNDPDSVTRVNLRALAAYPPLFVIRPDSLDVTAAERDSTTSTLTVKNDGTGPLSWYFGKQGGVPQGIADELPSRTRRGSSPDLINGAPQNTGSGEASLYGEVRSLAAAPLADLTGKVIGFVAQTQYSVIQADVQARGATIRFLSFPLTDSSLAGLDALSVDDLISGASSTDINRLRTWVQSGKGILLLADNAGSMTNVNLLLSGTGIAETSLSAFVSALLTQFVPHPITAGVDTILAEAYGSYCSVVQPAVTIVLDDLSRPHAAVSTLGSGRVVAVGNEVTGDFNIAVGDTRLFSNQLFDWLTSSGFASLVPSAGTVAPGDSQIVTVKIDASNMAAGDYREVLVLSSNDPVTPTRSVPIRLHLFGVPKLVLPDSVDVGATTYIGYPDTLSLLLVNIGSEHLVVLDATLDNPEFSIVGSTLFAIPSNTSRILQVRFNPSSPGPKLTVLTISSNDPDTLSFATLTGLAAHPPVISINPDSVSLSLNVGDSSTVQLTIDNSAGLGPLHFTVTDREVVSLPHGFTRSPSIIPYPRPSAEPFHGSHDWGYPLIQSEFAHAAQPLFFNQSSSMPSALPVILNDPVGDGGSADVTQIRGSSSGERLRISYLFAQPVSHDSLVTVLGIDIDQDTLTGNRNPFYHNIGADFYIVSNPPSGDSADIYDVNGVLMGRVFLNRQPQEVSFSVPYAMLEEEDGMLNFVAVSGLITAPTDWVPDVGYGTIVPDAAWITGDLDSGTVDPGGSMQVNLSVQTGELFGGSYTAVVSIASNDPLNPVVELPVSLDLTGIPAISLSDDTLDFGQVFTVVTKSLGLVITNDGTDVLTGSVGVEDTTFAVPDPDFSIAPLASKTTQIVFQPRALGASTASVIITSNTSTSPLNVVLVGEGVLAPNIRTTATAFTFQMNDYDTLVSSFGVLNTVGVPLEARLSDEVVSGSPGGPGEVLFAASGTQIHHINPTTGTVVKSIASPVSTQGPAGLAFSGEELYIEDTFSSPNIFVVDPENGAVLRSFPVPSASIDGLAYVSGKLYALEYARNLIFVLNPMNGAKIDSLQPAVAVGGGMDGSDGRLFVTSFSGMLHELNPLNGAVIRSVQLGDTFYGVAFGGGRLFLSSVFAGQVIELNPETGATIDTVHTLGYYALAGGGPVDAEWLTEDPANVTVDAGDTVMVQFRLTPLRLPGGQHRANIVLTSNDPDSSKVRIPVTVTVITRIAEEEGRLPTEFALNQNYPNPFNPSTFIAFDLPNEVHVSLRIYNILGQRVLTLVDEVRPGGRYSEEWNASRFSSGIYFYRITAGDFVQTRKMVLTK